MTIDYTDLYLDGRWVAPATNSVVPVISPSTEARIGSVPEGSEADIDAAVSAARTAFDDPSGWAHWDGKRRADALALFAEQLQARGEETSTRVSSQNGMPISLARQFESGFPALLLQYYGEMAADSQDEVRPGMLGGSTVVTRSPMGVVAAIVPWNVPQAITFLKLAPALAAGCTVVLKPAPETVLDAFLMAEAAAAAGLPPGVLNVVPGGRELGAYLVGHPGVDKVSFTGSTAAGRAIARTCGDLLRPVTLELGGKSAAIVLDDANLTDDIESFFGATMLNNGQICWLCTRVLAPAARYDEIVDIVTDLARNIAVGDPLSDTTQMGPLVSQRQRDRVEGYIAAGRNDGGRVTTGGQRVAERGWFIEPTVFADVRPEHTIAREEIFGPVLSVISYTDEDDAVAIANSSQYGLGGTVWTADAERGAQFARRIASGTVGINGYANDPTAPFGGIKNSGMGRELGPEGLSSYQNLKSIYLDVR